MLITYKILVVRLSNQISDFGFFFPFFKEVAWSRDCKSKYIILKLKRLKLISIIFLLLILIERGNYFYYIVFLLLVLIFS